MPIEPMRPDAAGACCPPRSAPNRVAVWVTLGYEYAVFWTGLALLAGLLLVWSVLAPILGLMLPRRIGTSLGRMVIMLAFRGYLSALTLSGLVRLDLDALDALRDERSLIIAPNHPSLLDVILMVSRLPHAVCIMKAGLDESIFLGAAARLAAYIRNDSAVSMVRQASMAVRAGGQLLIFPEGTRTVRKPVNPFKGGFALIARTAGVPVQTVFIETDSPFLGKGRPFFRKPEFPLVYRASLGRRFEVHGQVRTAVADIEGYFQESLQP